MCLSYSFVTAVGLHCSHQFETLGAAFTTVNLYHTSHHLSWGDMQVYHLLGHHNTDTDLRHPLLRNEEADISLDRPLDPIDGRLLDLDRVGRLRAQHLDTHGATPREVRARSSAVETAVQRLRDIACVFFAVITAAVE